MARRAIPRKLPVPTPPDSAEREYGRHLRRYAETYNRMLREALSEVIPDLKEEAAEELPQAEPVLNLAREDSVLNVTRLDANAEKTIRELFDLVQSRLEKLFPESTLRKWAQGMVGLVNRRAKQNMQKVGKAVDLELEPLMNDRGLTPYFQNIVEENVGLIRSMTERQKAQLKNRLVSAINQDLPQSEIREMLQDAFGKTKSAASLIARDQVGKLNGRIAKYRQQQLGARRYVWRTSKDKRVRDDHKRLDGKVFSWDKPPVVDQSSGRRGHPGEDFQCRCWAEMVLDDVLD